MASSRARTLRQNLAAAERLLWSKVRDRKLVGFKFRRQVPLGPYVADFACLQARLIGEIDGGQHAWRHEPDAARTAWLERQGFRVIRFWNNEVLENLDGVLLTILEALRDPPPPRPSPTRREGASKRPRFFNRRERAPAAPRLNADQATASRSGLPLPIGGEGRGEGA